MTDQQQDIPRYALIFRTHFWDEFVQRQFERAVSNVKSGDIFVLVDETRGKIPGIPTARVVGLTDDDIIQAGFVRVKQESIQWYSGDVPLYMFYDMHKDYEYYVQMEYDVNLHLNVDDLVAKVAADRVDVLGLTNLESVDEWHWLSTCLEAYGPQGTRHQLICLSAFSNKGIAKLYEKRLEQAALFKSGQLKSWPYCEGFVPSEAEKQGLKVAELSKYGDVQAYQWWPPYLESELDLLKKNTFVHPVLDSDRYVSSLFGKTGLRSLFSPGSLLHRKLRRVGMLNYFKMVFGRRFVQEVRAASARRKSRLVKA